MCGSVCVYVPIFLYLPTWSPPTRTWAQVTPNKKQEINTNHPTNTSLQGRKSKGRINTTLKSGKRRPQAEQVREEKKKDEKTEKYSTNEKARKKLPKPNNQRRNK